MEHRALYPWENEPPGGPQAQEPARQEGAKPAQEETGAPAAPGYVLAHAFGEDRVTLLWGEARRAEGYLILRGETPGGLKPIAAVEEPSYIDTQAQRAKTYYYSVRAYNERGQSAAAPPACVTLPEASQTDSRPPAREPAFAGKRLRLQKQAPRSEKYAKEDEVGAPPQPDGEPHAPTGLRAVPMGTRRIALQWDVAGTDAA